MKIQSLLVSIALFACSSAEPVFSGLEPGLAAKLWNVPHSKNLLHAESFLKENDNIVFRTVGGIKNPTFDFSKKHPHGDFLYELNAYFVPSVSGQYKFRLDPLSTASLQLGAGRSCYDNIHESVHGKLDIDTTKGKTVASFNLLKGRLYPMKIVHIPKKGDGSDIQLDVLLPNKKRIQNLDSYIVQAKYKYDIRSKDAISLAGSSIRACPPEIVISNSFRVRTFQVHPNILRHVDLLVNGYKRLHLVHEDPSVRISISPQIYGQPVQLHNTLIELTGHLKPRKSGDYKFETQSNIPVSIQVGPGTPVPDNTLFKHIDASWKQLHTSPKKPSLSLLDTTMTEDLYYPIRVVVFSPSATPQFSMNLKGPDSENIDISEISCYISEAENLPENLTTQSEETINPNSVQKDGFEAERTTSSRNSSPVSVNKYSAEQKTVSKSSEAQQSWSSFLKKQEEEIIPSQNTLLNIEPTNEKHIYEGVEGKMKGTPLYNPHALTSSFSESLKPKGKFLNKDENKDFIAAEISQILRENNPGTEDGKLKNNEIGKHVKDAEPTNIDDGERIIHVNTSSDQDSDDGGIFGSFSSSSENDSEGPILTQISQNMDTDSSSLEHESKNAPAKSSKESLGRKEVPQSSDEEQMENEKNDNNPPSLKNPPSGYSNSDNILDKAGEQFLEDQTDQTKTSLNHETSNWQEGSRTSQESSFETSVDSARDKGESFEINPESDVSNSNDAIKKHDSKPNTQSTLENPELMNGNTEPYIEVSTDENGEPLGKFTDTNENEVTTSNNEILSGQNFDSSDVNQSSYQNFHNGVLPDCPSNSLSLEEIDQIIPVIDQMRHIVKERLDQLAENESSVQSAETSKNISSNTEISSIENFQDNDESYKGEMEFSSTQKDDLTELAKKASDLLKLADSSYDTSSGVIASMLDGNEGEDFKISEADELSMEQINELTALVDQLSHIGQFKGENNSSCFLGERTQTVQVKEHIALDGSTNHSTENTEGTSVQQEPKSQAISSSIASPKKVAPYPLEAESESNVESNIPFSNQNITNETNQPLLKTDDIKTLLDGDFSLRKPINPLAISTINLEVDKNFPPAENNMDGELVSVSNIPSSTQELKTNEPSVLFSDSDSVSQELNFETSQNSQNLDQEYPDSFSSKSEKLSHSSKDFENMQSEHFLLNSGHESTDLNFAEKSHRRVGFSEPESHSHEHSLQSLSSNDASYGSTNFTEIKEDARLRNLINNSNSEIRPQSDKHKFLHSEERIFEERNKTVPTLSSLNYVNKGNRFAFRRFLLAASFIVGLL